jgi:hypothetical protein
MMTVGSELQWIIANQSSALRVALVPLQRII